MQTLLAFINDPAVDPVLTANCLANMKPIGFGQDGAANAAELLHYPELDMGDPFVRQHCLVPHATSIDLGRMWFPELSEYLPCLLVPPQCIPMRQIKYTGWRLRCDTTAHRHGSHGAARLVVCVLDICASLLRLFHGLRRPANEDQGAGLLLLNSAGGDRTQGHAAGMLRRALTKVHAILWNATCFKCEPHSCKLTGSLIQW